MCNNNEKVHNHQCILCKYGAYYKIRQDARGPNTHCVENDAIDEVEYDPNGDSKPKNCD